MQHRFRWLDADGEVGELSQQLGWWALVAYRRGSRRGGLLLAGALAYFLYVYASRALYNAYNPMFLGYIAVFSASVYALLLVVTAVTRAGLGDRLTQGPPRRAWPGSWPPAAR